MASLNFNQIHRPVLELTMADEAQTVIKVTTPNEALVRELEASLPELKGVLEAGDEESIRACYDLVARLINCNRSFITVTADQLREQYKMDLEYLVMFLSAYMDFIGGIANAKN